MKLPALLLALLPCACSLLLPNVDVAGLPCDAQQRCTEGFRCVDDKCVSENAEGEGEGVVAGEGEGEGAISGEGEGEGAGEGEGEGAPSCDPACTAGFVCVEQSCVVRLAPSLAGIDNLVIDDVARDLVVNAPTTLDDDVDENASDGFVGFAPQDIFSGVAVYVFRDVHITAKLTIAGTKPIAIVALHDFTVDAGGVIDASAVRRAPGPGAVPSRLEPGTGKSAGGANALFGAAASGGTFGGTPEGSVQCVPLVGGEAGADDTPAKGGGGGGAMALLSYAGFALDGSLVAHGGGGTGTPSTGGGAGGTILIEGDTVVIGGALDVAGGAGSDGTNDGADGAAPVPPGQPFSGDGSPGRIRINARTFSFEPSATVAPQTSCGAVFTVGRARVSSDPASTIAFTSDGQPSQLTATPLAAFSGFGPGAASGTAVGLDAPVGFTASASAGALTFALSSGNAASDATLTGTASVAVLGGASAGGTELVLVGGTSGVRLYAVTLSSTPAFTSAVVDDGVSSLGVGSSVAITRSGASVIAAAVFENGVHFYDVTDPAVPEPFGNDPELADIGVVRAVALADTTVAVTGDQGTAVFTGFAPPIRTATPADAIPGRSIATDGRYVVVGDDIDVSCGADAGNVVVVDLAAIADGSVGAAFTVTASPRAQTGERFGASVAVSQGRVLVGAPGAQTFTGTVYAFAADDFAGLVAEDALFNDTVGDAVAIDGQQCVLGAPRVNQAGQVNAGEVLSLSLGF